MPLAIFNTMTRKKEPFEPLDPGRRAVRIYNCGPTVYDHFHIGNARNFVVMDIARLYLSRQYQVTFAQNLTDIDDKIIKKMNDEGKTFEEVTETYKKAYFDDAAKLRIKRADFHPCATEFIPQMIDLMKRLEEKGMAYAAGGSLYYRVRKFAEYGKLSGRSVDDMLQGARVEANEEKEDALDFVLWKAAKPGEPKWPSPWGEGRPGWHLECSTMAMALLGETVDIHSGGTDLMFPHHENEIAQSEAASGKTFARCWMHNGFLNIDSEKMSKSLGNIMKIDQVLAAYPVEAVRFFLMSAHYRSPLDYNAGALEEATSAVRRINEGLATAKKILELAGEPIEAAGEAELLEDATARPFLDRFIEAMDDDFNTPRALAAIHDIVTAIHEAIRARPMERAKVGSLLQAGTYLRDFFGLEPGAAGRSDSQLVEGLMGIFEDAQRAAERKCIADLPLFARGGMPKEFLIQQLIECRKLAKKQKGFEVADLIRDRLKALGILLEDHAQGTIWKEAAPGEGK